MSEKEGPSPRWHRIAVVGGYLAGFALGFRLLSKFLEGYVSPGLAFILTAAAAMVVFVVLSPLFGTSQQAPQRKDKKDKPYTELWRALLYLDTIAAATSWSALAYIETNALSQPDRATGAFTVAVPLKGVVRYMTPMQHTIDQIANWAFFGCVFVLFAMAFVDKARQLRRNNGS